MSLQMNLPTLTGPTMSCVQIASRDPTRSVGQALFHRKLSFSLYPERNLCNFWYFDGLCGVHKDRTSSCHTALHDPSSALLFVMCALYIRVSVLLRDNDNRGWDKQCCFCRKDKRNMALEDRETYFGQYSTVRHLHHFPCVCSGYSL